MGVCESTREHPCGGPWLRGHGLREERAQRRGWRIDASETVRADGRRGLSWPTAWTRGDGARVGRDAFVITISAFGALLQAVAPSDTPLTVTCNANGILTVQQGGAT